MSDSWIISSFHFKRHASLHSALGERDRLASLDRKATFEIYRVKDTLTGGETSERINNLAARAYRAETALRQLLGSHLAEDQHKIITECLGNTDIAAPRYPPDPDMFGRLDLSLAGESACARTPPPASTKEP